MTLVAFVCICILHLHLFSLLCVFNGNWVGGWAEAAYQMIRDDIESTGGPPIAASGPRGAE